MGSVGVYTYMIYIFLKDSDGGSYSTWMMGAMQYGRSGGMEVSRAASGIDSSVIGGGVMAQHKRGGPDPTQDSEYVSGCSATSALEWLTAQHRGQPYRSTLGGIIDGRARVLPKCLKVLFITLL